MTEQETRGKIFNIIREFNVKKRRYSSHTEPSDDEELADALIVAGIGDVSEYKHRAEVAERALQIADELGELCGRKEDYVQQAEKELAEEAI